MNLLRKILFPFAILYGFITSFRNFLFDKGVLKSTSFDIPVIAVGNLSVGGTGKTPQIEYLIRLLSDQYKIATLSRGYKRQSKGFVLASATSNALILGDEPFQFYQKFPNIQVAVDADRTNGIIQLISQQEKPQIILLDDAYQHRKVKAGFYILLTSYGDLYADDCMLPTGNLRESRSGANRANIIVVTKCPKDLPDEIQNDIRKKLRINSSQQLYFTGIDYDDFIGNQEKKIAVSDIKKEPKLLLAGIAKPKPFFDYLKNKNDECLTFPDHHHFSEADIESILIKAQGKKIVTTEKDYVRLKDSKLATQLYYLPIRSHFLGNKQNFDATVLEYVKRSANLNFENL
ncbi:tetraacyldisaccharide 4'-kinase [Flavobacterium sp. Fl-77]|uniref:Tetraacyldisaccharide 4'-kinase n=1 Tax=Flavobacterium flavipigmentatum TaxID=2893884 RepID=A0AAJ2S8E6_9FLAO|nr:MULTISPECIES: tetraacyldisaccharide 4'-kinase [unclassified Flavobacterium]MDX6182306.1 tetraacyldisaccharide 4'-kinase [Flavobacterium sp. Fl-33]MDX6185781.1 tetraacyldisaccharide 4'-kinase [Flavobacterium sp. Fl-77]UFH38961.1 tetraacyldisaccharide 4'-kinase [Flavobacterium sp. F-70]